MIKSVAFIPLAKNRPMSACHIEAEDVDRFLQSEYREQGYAKRELNCRIAKTRMQDLASQPIGLHLPR